MPLADLGSLVVNHVVFLTHLVYINLAFSHADPGLIIVLYIASRLLCRHPEDLSDPKSSWAPNGLTI